MEIDRAFLEFYYLTFYFYKPKTKFVEPFDKARGLKNAMNAIYTTLQQDSAVLVHTPTLVATLLNIVTKFTTKLNSSVWRP